MNVVIAIDSFKGSLTSLQAGNAVKEAILRTDRSAEVVVRPLADGGEGTVDAFSESADAETVHLTVHGPLMKPVNAKYCILKTTNTAIIEMAAASGITLISAQDRNPLETTTFGVGELIRDAIEKGCRQFIVGIGGSATNDGGTGMLSALGYEFVDKNDRPISLGAQGLKDLHQIKTGTVLPQLKDCTFHIACDVTNPLCGPQGCSAVFGPQKGATAQMIRDMDSWLEHYAALTDSDKNHPGAGAAGGLGFAFLAFTNAVLEPGTDIILQTIKLENDIANADLVVTGEGRLDAQTVMGKAPVGVAGLAKKYGKPVIAFSGCVADGAELCNEHGIDAFFPILRSITTPELALDPKVAYGNLSSTAYQVFRLLSTVRSQFR